jgi:hypothetical protein
MVANLVTSEEKNKSLFWDQITFVCCCTLAKQNFGVTPKKQTDDEEKVIASKSFFSKSTYPNKKC